MIFILIAIIGIIWLSIFLSIRLGYTTRILDFLPLLRSENTVPIDAEIIE